MFTLNLKSLEAVRKLQKAKNPQIEAKKALDLEKAKPYIKDRRKPPLSKPQTRELKMPIKMTALNLLETLRLHEGEVFINLPTAGKSFTLKVFKGELMNELKFLPETENIQIKAGMNSDGAIVLSPSEALKKTMEFSTAPSLIGIKFAEKLREKCKGSEIRVKFPMGEYDADLKVSKLHFAKTVEETAPEDRTFMRMYDQKDGHVLVRSFA